MLLTRWFWVMSKVIFRRVNEGGAYLTKPISNSDLIYFFVGKGRATDQVSEAFPSAQLHDFAHAILVRFVVSPLKLDEDAVDLDQARIVEEGLLGNIRLRQSLRGALQVGPEVRPLHYQQGLEAIDNLKHGCRMHRR